MIAAVVWLIGLAVVLLAPSTSHGQQLTQYAHTAWRLQDGVFDTSPVSIAQTTDGFLWIGTLNGLVRFDGAHFESWNDRVHEIGTCCAFALLGSSDGSLWIGTGGGLARLREGKLSAVTKSDARYNSIIEDHKGRIWAARSRIRDSKGPLCEIEGMQVQCHSQNDGLGCRNGNVVAADKGGAIWVGDEGRVCSWKDGTAKAYSVSVTNTACKPAIGSLLADFDDSMLIGCAGSLQRLDRGSFVRFQGASLDADKLRGSQLLYDRGGSLWIGTTNEGVYHVANGIADHFGEADGLSDDSVSALYEDHEGNVWVATTNGIDRFHRLSVISFSSKQGLGGPGRSAVLASRDGHAIWTDGEQGLTAMRDGKITVITRKEGLPGQQVTALFEDDRGVLWMGIDQDLFSYSNGHFTKKLRSDGQSTGMVVGMTEDANRSLWIVTAVKDRLLRFDPKTGITKVVAKPQSPSRIARSPNGVVYLLSFLSGEIYILRNDGTFEDVPLPTGPRTGQNLLAYDQESLFVGTTKGLYRWKDRRWSSLTKKNGLPCDTVQDSANDQDGGLWLHLDCGFVNISKRDLDAWSDDGSIPLSPRLYDVLDGARAGRGSFEPAHTRTPNGQLWFANGSVLQMIDPRNLPHNELPPPVHILRVIGDRKIFSPLTSVALPALTHDLEIDYAALSLVSPEKVRFRYALWGADKDWQEVGARREAYYMGLRPGHYRFQVIACNNSGVWNQRGATLDLSIAPAYYQTNWFRALCACIFLALLWAAYQWRVRQLQRQFDMTLEVRVGERTRIARDLHDTLLQSAHGVLLRFQTVSQLLPGRPMEAKEKLDNAIDQTANFITEARDEVQGLRDSTIQGNDLAMAVSTLGQELETDSANRRPAFRVAVGGEARNLHPILRDEIYKIAAEALRNAFRHSQARQIEVEIRYDNDQFRLRVRDDGKGIDPAILSSQGSKGHYGLPGMRERAT
ncbi:MAG TPA: two-component regulator propeller domain-containing protein, partial [Candidatus Binatia bacterium]|nr:two-component regulator propeller domain-containing protein [Candidatus Binatia bacterium]